MSRFGEYDGDGDDEFNGNGGYMWAKRAELALSGRRGRKALAELREALLALPEHKLIAEALCTVGTRAKAEAMPERVPSWFGDGTMRENYTRQDLIEFVDRQGEGVCAVGAYIWHQRVKAGATPEEAFAALTMASVEDEGAETTAERGRDSGLTFTLAWELAYRNDEMMANATPEQRWAGFIAFIDKELAKPPLTRPAPKVKRKRQPAVEVPSGRGPVSGQLGAGL